MSISTFDLFKIGIGPSSSHTVGPMRAAAQFAREVLQEASVASRIARVEVHLYGSLAATATGHGTLDAVVMGLEGNDPEHVDPVTGRERVAAIEADGGLLLGGLLAIDLRPSTIVLHPLTILPQHPNGMTFLALDAAGEELVRRPMFSVGGGFVLDEADMDRPIAEVASEGEGRTIFTTGDELLRVCEDRGISVSDAMLLRERQWRSDEEIRSGLLRIWRAMEDCIDRGVHISGVLPGGLEVKRRASSWYDSLSAEDPVRLPMNAFEWVSLAALAVNEENAAGGRVVTAPTNGAAGIIPAVLYFATTYIEGVDPEEIAVRFLLTAGAIGSLYKEHASISGAEVGCQGEVGSACSMAAAALCEAMGGKPAQVENAAEIAMEHNLGLTCDPVGGLVQVPCIERNAMAAVKAITAARFALRGTGEHFVSLDTVIETMRQTGKDMNARYKETAMGGLAVTAVPVSLPDC
ncbi:L-serine ammonia-lyase [Brachybacterium alimentarium]|uniref:L-serine ammonia-lyase n=1 Tax=Brachybacterium alimentarium TaxID=47845 RepID=UPI000BB700BF|nr:L-serine ammonia-lyase [Brachybacterium alimentarium]PCC31524.1 L-serine ammonia-lyase [Brachybacterium alimentarium]RCS75724.1 L-serine ammonia-lyase [Brachybacterium alimentarium]